LSVNPASKREKAEKEKFWPFNLFFNIEVAQSQAQSIAEKHRKTLCEKPRDFDQRNSARIIDVSHNK